MIEIVNKERVLRELKKKLKNFLTKAPIQAKVRILDKEIFIYHYDNTYRFDIDFSLPVKKIIYNIREYLIENVYPKILLTYEKRLELTPEEKEVLIRNGMDFDDILNTTKLVKTQKQVTLIRVIMQRDELFLLSKEDKKIYYYKLKMPLILFMKKLREEWTISEAGEVIFKKGVLLNEINIDE